MKQTWYTLTYSKDMLVYFFNHKLYKNIYNKLYKNVDYINKVIYNNIYKLNEGIEENGS